MRAPNEEAIDNVGAPAHGAERPQPPGGKPLMRMLQLLGQAGYEDAAADAVTTAIDESQRPEFQEFAQRLAPAFTAPAKTSKARRAKAEQAPAAAEDAANETMRAAEFLGPPTATGPQWRSLGPATVPNGQTYGSSRVNVSGRIAAIAVDPCNAAHVLAGAANGGVWESFDRGKSWAPRTDYAATLAVGAVTFDPTNPRTVYCGLGEGNWWSWLGTGVLRSTDGGTTWAQRCTTPFVGQGFYDLVVDPANGNHLLAATTGGLYVSTDAGSQLDAAGAPRRTCSSRLRGRSAKARDPRGEHRRGLVRSTNGGTTWTAVTLPGAPAGFNRLAVAIAPSSHGRRVRVGRRLHHSALHVAASDRWRAQAGRARHAAGRDHRTIVVRLVPGGVTRQREPDLLRCDQRSSRHPLSGTTWTWLDISDQVQRRLDPPGLSTRSRSSRATRTRSTSATTAGFSRARTAA